MLEYTFPSGLEIKVLVDDGGDVEVQYNGSKVFFINEEGGVYLYTFPGGDLGDESHLDLREPDNGFRNLYRMAGKIARVVTVHE